MSKEKEKENNEQLPEGELKFISIDCPNEIIMPIPPEEMPEAFASFFNFDNKEDKQ